MEWVSVSERMPEPQEEVLVALLRTVYCDRRASEKCYLVFIGAWYPKDGWMNDTATEPLETIDGEQTAAVTHWAAIPPKPLICGVDEWVEGEGATSR